MPEMIAQETLVFHKGDIICAQDQPKWALSVIGDYPLQYGWLYPYSSARGLMQNAQFQVMKDTTLERFGNSILLSFGKTIN